MCAAFRWARGGANGGILSAFRLTFRLPSDQWREVVTAMVKKASGVGLMRAELAYDLFGLLTACPSRCAYVCMLLTLTENALSIDYLPFRR